MSDLSLRDRIAIEAMKKALEGATIPPAMWSTALPVIAEFSYRMAEAMIREKTEQGAR
jgi:hypothetical protein